MAVKRVVNLPAIMGVVQGQTATLDVPVGPRYHVIWLIAQATTKTLTQIVSEIRIKINGKVQRVHTAAELDALNTLMNTPGLSLYNAQNSGGAGNPYLLPVFLAEPWRGGSTAEGMAWGTGNVSTFQIEIDLNATAGAGVTLSANAEVDNSVVQGANGSQSQAGLGIITKWFRTQVTINGTTQNLTQLPKRSGAYQQISLFDANITRVQVKVENFIIRDVTKSQMDAALVARGMTPIAGRCDVVFDYDDMIGNALPMSVQGRAVQDFQVNLTLSDGTPRNIATIYQVIGNPE